MGPDNIPAEAKAVLENTVDMLQPLFEMEGGIFHQINKERGPKQLLQLHGYYITFDTRKSLQ